MRSFSIVTRAALTFVATVALLLRLTPHAHAATTPNLVLLIGDDHGWPYSGFMGDPIVRTPNLDALAAGGTTFTHAQNPSSLCQATLRGLLAAVHSEQWDAKRAALQTTLGRITVRSEVAHFRTLPRELTRRGYLAWEGGKLWEGTFATAGFTHGLATSISPNLFTSVGDHFGRDGWSDGTTLQPLQEFLDQAGSAPFFLWVAPLLPHLPFDAPAELSAPYAGLGLSPAVAGYYANVSWLDALVGAVVAELDARGLRDDTLIVYVSDNGWDIVNPGVGQGHGKATLYELGFRTPLIVNWPGHVAPGVRRDDLVSTLDVPATLLDYAGADQLADGSARSLKDAIESGAPVGRDKLVSHFAGEAAANNGYWVRTPTWRYVVAEDGREELYEIASDPLEQVDVAALHPDLLPGFRSDVLAWQESIDSGLSHLDSAGRLVDGAGAPVAGETLELKGRTRGGLPVRLRVLTSASGDFLFQSVPQGTYKLQSRRRTAALAFGRELRSIPVTLPVGGLGSFQRVVAVQDEPPRVSGAATVRGVLRSLAGTPVSDAAVTVKQSGPHAAIVTVLTASDGSYRAENLPAGSYRVTAIARTPAGRVTVWTEVGAAGVTTLDLTLPR